MAEQSDVIHDLKALVVAQPHESYGDQLISEMRIISQLAEHLLTLNPKTVLPNAKRSNRRYDYRNIPNDMEMQQWDLAQRNGLAHDITHEIRRASDQLIQRPSHQQQLDTRQNNFSHYVAVFVRSWNYLIPTLHVLNGPDTTSQVAKTLEQLREASEDAQRIVTGMRDASGQVGLSRESTHFKNAADQYEKNAGNWLIATVVLASTFVVAAVAAVLAFRLELIAPQNSYENVQLVAAKVLIFAGLSFMILLCARSYSANRHNAVVNRHRQDALLTYQALVEAAKDTTNRDVILQQAATCIFGPQATGFTKDGVATSEAPSAKSIVGLVEPIARQ